MCSILKSVFFIYFLLLFISCSPSIEKMAIGKWEGVLELHENIQLPFIFNLEKNTVNYEITILNGDEEIQLRFDFEQSIEKDSLVYVFDVFHTYLIFKSIDENNIKGYWVNNDRKNHPRIPFEAHLKEKVIKEQSTELNTKIEGNWEVYFDYTDENLLYPAVGIFKPSNRNDNLIDGTFLTETGDYRFLSGSIENNLLTLSCFDGSHAFLFTANLYNDSLSGIFYSGSHWKTEWYGIKNDTFSLTNPYELTYIINDQPLNLKKKNLLGEVVNFPSSLVTNKVVILQVFGSWCPNCLDETLFYNDLYEEYANKGLEIIGIGYELPEKEEEKLERLNKYKEKLGVKYPLLLGGKANKQVASEDFPMINSISSFPTTFFINREGYIVKIHTGFNGPGTGEIYEEYTREVKSLIERLIQL